MEKQADKLAVLIDADNISAEIIALLLEEIAKYGIASVKRIYGDWSSPNLTKWRDVLLPHAITPVQQFAYTKGKNATDIAMVIDAMDLLYSGTFDAFCLVSSDSDFTRLASRIRESGLTVYGFGRQNTPEALRKACDKFIYIEILQLSERDQENHAEEQATPSTSTKETVATENHAGAIVRHSANQLKGNAALMNLIRNAVEEHSDDEGWANLGGVGQYMLKVNSDFDPRNYGYAKLSEIIKTINLFETKSENKAFYLRLKKKT